jgi:hypothetical protein
MGTTKEESDRSLFTSLYALLNTSDFKKPFSENNGSVASTTMDNEAVASKLPDAPTPDNDKTDLKDLLPSNEDDSDARENRPELPPRQLDGSSPPNPSGPSLQAKATTALSSIDIQTVSFPDGSRGTFSTSDGETIAPSGSRSGQSILAFNSRKSSGVVEADDNASIMSYAPTNRAPGDLESLLGGNASSQTAAYKLLSSQVDAGEPFEAVEYKDDDRLANFEQEFVELDGVDSQRGNEGIFANNIKQFSLTFFRSVAHSMEIEIKALYDIIFGGKAHIQQTW